MENCFKCQNYDQEENKCYPYKVFEDFIYCFSIVNPYSEDNCCFFDEIIDADD